MPGCSYQTSSWLYLMRFCSMGQDFFANSSGSLALLAAIKKMRYNSKKTVLTPHQENFHGSMSKPPITCSERRRTASAGTGEPLPKPASGSRHTSQSRVGRGKWPELHPSGAESGLPRG